MSRQYGTFEEEVDFTINAPQISYLKLFWMFLSFGFRAWGGPFAQIAMMKEELVDRENWITTEQFNRALAVYQVLPGPEATELACYFGMVAKGRLGSVLAGLGFVLPGFGLMLFLSWFYMAYGLSNMYINALFLGLQPAVAAMIFKAVHKIGDGCFIDKDKKELNEWLLLIAVVAGIQQVMGINFFIILVWCGLEALFIIEFPKSSNKRKKYVGYVVSLVLLILGLMGYIIYVVYLGKPESSVIASNVIVGRELHNLFLLGLLAGLVTFGGAYTAVPFVQQSAVFAGKWLSNEIFLDGIALASVMPAPLVIFNTFVGYVGGSFPGAILMTLGVFLPAFSFTLIGHNLFEKITHFKPILTFLDGVTAAAVGLIGVSAFIFVKSALHDMNAMVIFILSLGASYVFNHKITNMVIIVIAALSGEIFYASPNPPNITTTF